MFRHLTAQTPVEDVRNSQTSLTKAAGGAVKRARAALADQPGRIAGFDQRLMEIEGTRWTR